MLENLQKVAEDVDDRDWRTREPGPAPAGKPQRDTWEQAPREREYQPRGPPSPQQNAPQPQQREQPAQRQEAPRAQQQQQPAQAAQPAQQQQASGEVCKHFSPNLHVAVFVVGRPDL